MKHILLSAALLLTMQAGAQPAAAVNNGFAFRFYHASKPSAGKNFCFSPYSITSAFAMTYAGTAGETEKEFQRVFGFAPNTANFHSSFQQLSTVLMKGNSGSNSISVANRLFPQKNMKLEKNFLSATNSYYGAAPEPLDYDDAEASRSHINTWVEKQTQHRIQDLLPAGSISGDTRLVLVNALYLKCKWASRFEASETSAQPFYGDDNTTKTVQLMNQQEKVGYYADRRIRAVELPYKDSALSMIIVLPATQQPLDSIRSYFDLNMYNAMVQHLQPQEVDIYLPKFKTSYGTSLKQSLSDIGMSNAFSERADFSLMSRKDHLFISDAFHKTFVEVDESGTEAAAATAVVMNVDSATAALPTTFRADRPFIYIIRERSTGAILFLGELHAPDVE